MSNLNDVWIISENVEPPAPIKTLEHIFPRIKSIIALISRNLEVLVKYRYLYLCFFTTLNNALACYGSHIFVRNELVGLNYYYENVKHRVVCDDDDHHETIEKNSKISKIFQGPELRLSADIKHGSGYNLALRQHCGHGSRLSL